MSDNKQYILYGILAGSLLFNMGHIFFSDSSDSTDEVVELEKEEVMPEDIDEGVAQAEEQVQDLEHQEALSSEWTVVKAPITQSLTHTFVNANIEKADALSMVFSRLFVWDIDMGRDLMKGDQVEVIYRIGDDGHPDIGAARLVSKKHGKIYTAFKWKAPEDEFSSYWSFDGTETNHRLKNSPIADFEQITSLLKDGRGHKGMDFKAPVGTSTTTPKSGKVTRVNFGNFRYNGNCVEIEFSDGILAKYLHMEKILVKEGESVKAGTAVGLVGNTGRSYAPHLHYQLNKGERVLDPVDYHGTIRRKLSNSTTPDFLRDIGAYINALDASIVADL